MPSSFIGSPWKKHFSDPSHCTVFIDGNVSRAIAWVYEAQNRWLVVVDPKQFHPDIKDKIVDILTLLKDGDQFHRNAEFCFVDPVAILKTVFHQEKIKALMMFNDDTIEYYDVIEKAASSAIEDMNKRMEELDGPR